MKVFYTLAIILTIISVSQCGPLDLIGRFLSSILRADILDIIDCILHNQIIIKDLNVIIDAILTLNFNNIINALMKVVMELQKEITACINPPQRFF